MSSASVAACTSATLPPRGLGVDVGAERLEGDEALDRCSRREPVLHRRHSFGELPRECRRVEAGQVALDDVGAGAGEPGDLVDLVVTMLRQRADREEAGLEQRVPSLDGLGRVGELQRDRVLRLEPEIEEAGGETVGGRVQLGVGQATIRRDDGDPLGVGTRHAPERRRDRLGAPVAEVAIAAGTLGRVRHEALPLPHRERRP